MSTDISVSNLSHDISFTVPRQEILTVAVCVHGGELALSRLWGSVKVLLEFDSKTEVQFYEAERLVHFKNIFCNLFFFMKMKCVNNFNQ